jgi:hypothetical protein
MDALIKDRLDSVLSRIEAACKRAGRNPQEVEVMAVTKYAGEDQIAALLADGRIKHVGENRVQPSMQRWQSPALADRKNVTLHLIGHLQSNKAAKAAGFFGSVDSLDNLETAITLGKKAQETGRIMPVMVQIKLTGRETQSGASLDDAGRLAEAASKIEGLAVRGYMAIAPVTENEQELRPLFGKVRALFDRDFPQPSVKGFRCYLSLGMTGDFETAVEEGSTLPRIGSAIFAQQEGVHDSESQSHT